MSFEGEWELEFVEITQDFPPPEQNETVGQMTAKQAANEMAFALIDVMLAATIVVTAGLTEKVAMKLDAMQMVEEATNFKEQAKLGVVQGVTTVVVSVASALGKDTGRQMELVESAEEVSEDVLKLVVDATEKEVEVRFFNVLWRRFGG